MVTTPIWKWWNWNSFNPESLITKSGHLTMLLVLIHLVTTNKTGLRTEPQTVARIQWNTYLLILYWAWETMKKPGRNYGKRLVQEANKRIYYKQNGFVILVLTISLSLLENLRQWECFIRFSRKKNTDKLPNSPLSSQRWRQSRSSGQSSVPLTGLP